MYIILGCDDIGCALARNLNKTGEDVVVVDVAGGKMAVIEGSADAKAVTRLKVKQ